MDSKCMTSIGSPDFSRTIHLNKLKRWLFISLAAIHLILLLAQTIHVSHHVAQNDHELQFIIGLYISIGKQSFDYGL